MPDDGIAGARAATGRPLALLDAPSNLGLRPPVEGREPGVRGMARRLRELGLRDRLAAMDAGEVVPPRYSPTRDAATGVRNAHEIAEYSRTLASAIGAQLDANRFPVVIGGDCSILLGSLLALHRRGRFGLMFLDGHEDLQTPQVSASGGAAGMDMALALGIGPPLLAALAGESPLVDPRDVWMVGPRDDPAAYRGEDVQRARKALTFLSLADVRDRGAAAVGADIARAAAASRLAGAWVHLDVDVLDNTVMPAVDSPQPDGLSYDELHALVRPIVESGRCVGMHVTIYDPDLDDTGAAGRKLVDGLARLLR